MKVERNRDGQVVITYNDNEAQFAALCFATASEQFELYAKREEGRNGDRIARQFRQQRDNAASHGAEIEAI